MERDQLIRHGLFAGVLLAAFVAIVVASGLNGAGVSARTVELSGETETRNYEVADFDGIRVRGGFEITVTAGEDHDLSIRGDTALLDIITARVENGVLVIKPEGEINIREYEGLTADIGLPSLRVFVADGAAETDLLKIDSESLDIIINDAGELNAAGRCGAVRAVVNGAGEVDLRDLQCSDAAITINGAGEARIFATQTADVAINGLGDVHVYGNPATVNKMKAGLGDITVHDGTGE